MQIRVAPALFGTCAIIGVVIFLILGQNPSGSVKSSKQSCKHGLIHPGENVAVIYDFSTTTSNQLATNLERLLKVLNMDIVSEVILVENDCKDKSAMDTAVEYTKKNDKLKLVIIDSNNQKVSKGRSRIEGLKLTKAPYLLFISDGVLPTSDYFLEMMVTLLKQTPTAVIVPEREGASQAVPHLNWALSLVAEKSVYTIDGDLQLPVADDEVFMMRSDLLQAVGSFDEFFHKFDKADSIAFSLSVWLCGGSILRSSCLTASGAEAMIDSSDKPIKFMQHAKYIKLVFGGDLAEHIAYPGVEMYPTTVYDNEASKMRKDLLAKRKCLPLEWYAQKFSTHLQVKHGGPQYEPHYKPLLPVYHLLQKTHGRWFVLHAGYCIFVSGDSFLGLGWCPQDFTQDSLFEWESNGQLRSGGRCVTLKSDSGHLYMDECAKNNTNQLFSYDKKSRKMKTTGDYSKCITHINGPEGRQMLSPMDCAANEPYNIFVFNDEY